jgi:hypothetical protein
VAPVGSKGIGPKRPLELINDSNLVVDSTNSVQPQEVIAACP